MSADRKEPLVYLRTFGCQMNEHDSRKMEQLLRRKGYATTDDPKQAELVVVNTCTVRDKAEQKLFSEIGRYKVLKRNRPEMKIAVAGCVAQRLGEGILKRAPYVDVVLGPDNIGELPALVDEARGGARIARTELYEQADYPFIGESKSFPRAQPTAYVTVQKGCSKRCTFCIVPTVRGDEVSRTQEDVVAECEALSAQGVREVTLLGQTINSYGNRIGDSRSFAELLRAVSAVDGIERVRFTTSYPRDFGDDIIACFAEVPEVMEFLHLPVQSGSDRVLRRMGRQYQVEEYRERIARLRESVPHIGLATDIIVGFPGESEEDFQQTMDLLEEMRFDTVFSFLYSPRPGTPAVKLMMRDDVPAHVKTERLMRLQKRQQEIGHENNRRFAGQTVEVLVEGPSKSNPERLTGRSRCNRPVHFPGSYAGTPRRAQVGDIVPVAVEEAGAFSLLGRALHPELQA